MVAAAAPTVEIEINEATNASLMFAPLGRRIRGCFEVLRCKEGQSRDLLAKWPQVIPGQRLAIDADGNGLILDPLRSEENSALCEKIKRAGFSLPPAAEKIPGIDLATWLYWMKNAVDCGQAKIISGSFPAKLPGDPKKKFFGRPSAPDPITKLTAAIEKQTEVMGQLLAAVLKPRG